MLICHLGFTMLCSTNDDQTMNIYIYIEIKFHLSENIE
jgi:hypothetical protein